MEGRQWEKIESRVLVDWRERMRLERRVLMSVRLLELEIKWGLFNSCCILLSMEGFSFLPRNGKGEDGDFECKMVVFIVGEKRKII